MKNMLRVLVFVILLAALVLLAVMMNDSGNLSTVRPKHLKKAVSHSHQSQAISAAQKSAYKKYIPLKVRF